MRVLLLALLASCPPLFAVTIYGVHSGGNLIRFDSATPSTVTTIGPLTGLAGGDLIQGIDIRPADGLLYGFSTQGNLYRIDKVTAIATLIGASGQASTLDASIDFNPIVDRLRVVDLNDANFRVLPATGALAVSDTPLSPSSVEIVACAYDRSLPGATLTTLYALDRNGLNLVTIGGLDGTPSPNGGTVSTVGSLGITFTSGVAGLDIDAGSGTAYAMINQVVSMVVVSRLYTINLTTGAATLVGDIGLALASIDIAVELPPNDPPAVAVPATQATARDVALVFSTATGNAITVSDPDAGSAALTATLTALSGTLTLAVTTGLTFTSGDGAADSTMVFSGSATNINAALNGLTFTPNSGVTGAGAVQVGVSDNGFSGSGGALTDSELVLISIGFGGSSNGGGDDEEEGCVAGDRAGYSLLLGLGILAALVVSRRRKRCSA